MWTWVEGISISSIPRGIKNVIVLIKKKVQFKENFLKKLFLYFIIF